MLFVLHMRARVTRRSSQAVYEPDKWRGFHPEAKSFWKFFEAAWQARLCRAHVVPASYTRLTLD